MAELSKQALLVENNTNFPDNNTGYITPALLRQFNVDSIDSTVNQTAYNSDSSSWNISIGALNTFTASQQPSFTALNAFTASQLVVNTNLNAFTQSAAASITNLNAYTASHTGAVSVYDEGVLVSNNINAFNFTGNGITASYVSGKAVVEVNFTPLNAFTASQTIVNTNLNSYTSSQDVRNATLAVVTSSLNSATASLQNTTSSLNAFTQSAGNSINLLNSFTASFSTGSLVSTSSFNNYTASTNADLAAIHQATSSLQSATQSLQAQLTTIGGQSGSWITEAETASFAYINKDNNWSANQTFTNISAVSASFTYVKTLYETSSVIYSSGSNQFGDAANDTQTLYGSTNIVNELTASGLHYPTADGLAGQYVITNGAGTLSFDDVHDLLEDVRYGENITIGDPLYVSGSNGNRPVVYKADASNSAKMPVIYIASSTNVANTNTTAITLGLITGVTTTGYPAGTTIYVAEGGGWSSSRPSGSASIVQALGIVTKEGAGGSGRGLVLNPGPATLPNLQTGYVWAGNSGNQPTAVATSSFVSSTLTGSFATTGSNQFNGNQVITGSLFVSSSSQDDVTIVSQLVISGSGTSATTRPQLKITGSGATNVIQRNSIVITNTLNNNLSQINPATILVNSGSGQAVGLNVATGSLSNTNLPGLFTSDATLNNIGAMVFDTNGSASVLVDTAFAGNINATGTFTASLANGYVWVGNSSNRTALVATSSFASLINTGSFLTTGSYGAYQNLKGGLVITGSEGLVISGSDNRTSPGIRFPWTDGINNKSSSITQDITGSLTISSVFYDGMETASQINVYTPGNFAVMAPFYSNAGAPWRAGGNIIGGSLSLGAYDPNTQSPTGSAFGGVYANVDITADPTNFFNGNLWNDNVGNTLGFAISAYNSPNGSVRYCFYGPGTGYNKPTGTPDNTAFYFITGSNKMYFMRDAAFTGSVEITGSFSASLANGYTWVGNSSNKTTLVATSSFATNISNLATTGSNTFIGTESISGSLNITGSAYGNVVSMSITSNTASMDLSAGNYFELTSSVTPLRIEFTNIKPGLSSTLIISASASSSIILGSAAAQPSGSAYSGSAGSIDILSFVAFNTSKLNVIATKALI